MCACSARGSTRRAPRSARAAPSWGAPRPPPAPRAAPEPPLPCGARRRHRRIPRGCLRRRLLHRPVAVELARHLGAVRRWSQTTWRIGILTFLATGLAVLAAANLSLGDKKIDTSVTSLYGVADPEFVRTMSVMLGPALVPGNRTRALVNGDEIFPEM